MRATGALARRDASPRLRRVHPTPAPRRPYRIRCEHASVPYQDPWATGTALEGLRTRPFPHPPSVPESEPGDDGSILAGLPVLVVDDHALLAQSLVYVLQSEGVAASLVTGPTLGDIVSVAAEVRPRVVLLDQNLGQMGDAQEIIGELTALGCTVVMITAITDRVILGECVEAGAVGIIDKSAPVESVLEAVARAAESGMAMTEFDRQEYLRDLRTARSERRNRLTPFENLTPREQEVLIALGDGLTAAEIVEELYLSMWTVRGHIKSILAKLGVSSQLTAVAKARQAGWM